MKIVVCDDVISDAKKAEIIIKKIISDEENEICIKTPKEIYLALEEGLYDYDIIVLDIHFKGENYNGIDLGKMINDKFSSGQIIYLTDVLEFASYVYETEHCYFVTKENMEIMLPKALNKAINEWNEGLDKQIIEFQSKNHKVVLMQKDIIYIEKDSRILLIHTEKKSYPCYLSLRKIEGKLSKSFLRCHGSFIVNLAYCTSIDGEDVYLKNDCCLPIGKTFMDKFKLGYLKYFSAKI